MRKKEKEKRKSGRVESGPGRSEWNTCHMLTINQRGKCKNTRARKHNGGQLTQAHKRSTWYVERGEGRRSRRKKGEEVPQEDFSAFRQLPNADRQTDVPPHDRVSFSIIFLSSLHPIHLQLIQHFTLLLGLSNERPITTSSSSFHPAHLSHLIIINLNTLSVNQDVVRPLSSFHCSPASTPIPPPSPGHHHSRHCYYCCCCCWQL